MDCFFCTLASVCGLVRDHCDVQDNAANLDANINETFMGVAQTNSEPQRVFDSGGFH